ncbi:exodeoxyribonuclease VII large subunit [Myxococcus hansupus]|uniref:exodeoxyribonuclease VII large subunit n=1 Tax=Pseudomyxococcus hansupus TaxID=1297742 RepID=UPI00067627BA|nr:exodeoxyribonuclease VII large subunit [Myxococcus hansupus]
MQRGLRKQKAQHFSIRSVIKLISDDVQPLARKALPSREMILVGEVVEVRGRRVCLADTYGFDKRVWVVLPGDCTWLPGLAHMVEFEGSARAFVDEERGGIDVRFMAKSWTDRGPSSRHARHQAELDAIAAGRLSPPPKVTRPFTRVALVTSEGSEAVADFSGQLEDTIGIRVQVELIPVGLYDEESIADGLRRAQDGGAEVVVLARGGGSRIDLQPFNSPVVARALCQLTKPCIVAVGHARTRVEAQRFAAYRARTPSVAAHLVARLFRRVQPLSEQSTPVRIVTPLPATAQVPTAPRPVVVLPSGGASRNPGPAEALRVRALPAQVPSAAVSDDEVRRTSRWLGTAKRVAWKTYWGLVGVLALGLAFVVGWKGAARWDGLVRPEAQFVPSPGVPAVDAPPPVPAAVEPAKKETQKRKRRAPSAESAGAFE